MPLHRIPVITWLLILFVLLAGSYSVVNPLFEAPDEVWHYELVRWLADGKGLPEPEDIGSAPWQQEGAQPPLYYLIGAALTAPIDTSNASEVLQYNPHASLGIADAPDNKNMMAHGTWEAWPWHGVVLAAHLVRFFSVLLGAITLFFTWRTALLIFPTVPPVAWLATALVAFNPQFLFISASISNDNLVTCCAAIGIWLLVRLLHDHWDSATPPSLSTLLGLGVILGTAALSKVSGLALSGLAGLVLLLIAGKRRSLLDLLRMAGWVAFAGAVVAFWWYWRNWQLFGDPLAINILTAVFPGREQPLSWGEILMLFPSVWRSYWGVFGWFNITVESWLYSIYSVLTGLALIGLLTQIRRNQGVFNRLAIALLTLWILLIGALVVRWAQINYPQGRLLFPASGALAILLAVGLLAWIPLRAQRIAALALVTALLIPAAIAPARWIAPLYRPPVALAKTTPIQNPLAVSFGDQLQLHGFAISAEPVEPGEHWQLTLYWSALQPMATNYSIFVHLIDEAEIVQAQHDSFPAGGNLPTAAMTVGQIVPDLHPLQIPLSSPAFSHMTIEIGVYDFQTGQRLTLPSNSINGTMLGTSINGVDHLSLGEINIGDLRASDGSVVSSKFGEQIELINYRIDRMQVAPGEPISVELTWQALRTISQNYVVFVHLLLPPDAVWAQVDELPLQGQQATSTWQKDQIIHDRHTLTVPENAPSGIYRIEIGLYDPLTMDRLKVNLEDAGVPIGSVRVE